MGIRDLFFEKEEKEEENPQKVNFSEQSSSLSTETSNTLIEFDVNSYKISLEEGADTFVGKHIEFSTFIKQLRALSVLNDADQRYVAAFATLKVSNPTVTKEVLLNQVNDIISNFSIYTSAIDGYCNKKKAEEVDTLKEKINTNQREVEDMIQKIELLRKENQTLEKACEENLNKIFVIKTESSKLISEKINEFDTLKNEISIKIK